MNAMLLNIYSSLSRWSVLFGAMIVLSGIPVLADELYNHPGYLNSVEDEKYQVTEEVVIMPYKETYGLTLRDKIFTEKLTKDFRKEYEDRFGRTEAEQLESSSNRFVETIDSGRLVPYNEHIKEQEKFGNYIFKELAEYHIDNYLRSDRSTRGIYEVKEKISNISVETAQGYKLKIKYKLSSNNVEFSMMKPKQKFHPRFVVNLSELSTLDGARLFLNYELEKNLQLESNYIFDQEIYAVGLSRRVTPALRTSVTAQRLDKQIGTNPPQDRILFGLTWND
jgi:hypothetical protein